MSGKQTTVHYGPTKFQGKTAEQMNAERRLNKQSKRPAKVAKASSAEIEQKKLQDQVIATAVKTVKSYDACSFVAACARGTVKNSFRVKLSIDVAEKMITSYVEATTITGTHTARMKVALAEVERRYPRPNKAIEYGIERATSALNAGARNAEAMRQLDTERARRSAVTAMDIIVALDPKVLDATIIANVML